MKCTASVCHRLRSVFLGCNANSFSIGTKIATSTTSPNTNPDRTRSTTRSSASVTQPWKTRRVLIGASVYPAC